MTTNTYTPVSLDIIDTLNGTTATILEFAKALATDKKYLSRSDFSKLVQSLPWSSDVVNKYINIGIAFFDIEISRLINIEPTTLFKITSNKRFAAVVDGIKNAVGYITQQFVEHLIQSNKKAPNSDENSNDNSATSSLAAASTVAIVKGPTPSTTASFDWEVPSNTSNIEESPTIVEESRNSPIVEKNEHPTPSPAYFVIEIKSEEQLSYKGELSAKDIAELLKECATWSEIQEITSSPDKPTRTESWLQLSREEQTRILELKRIASIEHIPSNTVEETPIIKVGDTVIWNNCWPHLSSWNPFQVENIEDDYAKLNNLKTPVPVEELSLVL